MCAHVDRTIDEEEKARSIGYRNFLSFVSIHYYTEKKTLKQCGELLGVSETKIKTSLVSRGLSIRKRGRLPGVAPEKKRSVNIFVKVRQNTPFIFPWCALYIYYEKYLLTTYEVGEILKISQTLVCKLLKKYHIKIRNKGLSCYKRGRKEIGKNN
jgi:hypothetical protein